MTSIVLSPASSGIWRSSSPYFAGDSLADDAADVALAKAVGDEGCHASPVEAAAAASEAFGLTPVELREGELAVIFR